MLPAILALIVGIVFIFASTLIGKEGKRVEEKGIATVGVVTGFHTLDGGDVRIDVHFTDADGVERSGRSQQFSRTYDRYKVGDSISIKYITEKKLGMNTVTLRVMDDQMKESGAMVATMIKGLGIVFIVLGVLSLFL